jgi:hypothetical protein
MRMRNARIWGLIGLVSTLLVLALPASADDWRAGQAVVSEVDTSERTITLDGEVFRVPALCRISAVSGTRVPLSTLRVATRPGVRIVPMNEVDYVHYEAVQKRRGWEMVRITILDGMPE